VISAIGISSGWIASKPESTSATSTATARHPLSGGAPA